MNSLAKWLCLLLAGCAVTDEQRESTPRQIPSYQQALYVKFPAKIFVSIVFILSGCAGYNSTTGLTYTFPFTVGISWSMDPIPVVAAPIVKPILVVPEDVAAVVPSTTVIQATQTSPQVTVPVVAASVQQPMLMVPKVNAP